MQEIRLADSLKMEVEVIKKTLWPNLVTGLLFCVLLSGFFYLDTLVHRFFLYLLFPIGIIFLKQNKPDDINVVEIIKDPLVVLALSFLAFTLTSILWSYNSSPELLWTNFKTAPFILVTGVIFISYLNKYPNSWMLLMQIFTLASVLSGLFLLAKYRQDIWHAYLVGGDENRIWRLQGIGRAENSNLAGLLYSLSFFALYFNNYKASQLPRILAFTTRPAYRYIGALITVLIMFLTLSRGAIAACILTFGVITFLKLFQNSGEARIFFFTILVAIFVTTLSVVFLPDIWTYMIERGTTGRVDIWSSAVSHYIDSPIWGQGIATPFKYAVVFEGSNMQEFNHTHNVYLNVMLHTGLIGFGIFVSLCFVALSRAYQSFKRESDVISFAFLFYGLVFGLVEFGGFYKSLGFEWLVFWLPISMLIHKEQAEKKDCQEKIGATNYSEL